MALQELPERAVRWFDDVQQQRWWLAHPVATIRKYADDRCSAFAGLVTFQIFLGMLPLLVVVLTVFSRVLEGSEQLRRAALESTFAQLPVIGSRLEEDLSTLAVSGPWLIVSVAGLLWTAAGIYHGLQLALNQVWNVEGVHRQGFVSRHLRALLLFALVISAAIGTAFVRGENIGLPSSSPTAAASALVGAAASGAILLGVLRIVVSPDVRLRHLVPAAVLAGLLWELLQRVGSWIVMSQLAGAEDLFGAIGFVVVLLLWINLLSRSVLLANEWAVVSWKELWPRRIAQPPLTEADKRVLAALARNERRRPEQRVDVSFDEDRDEDRPVDEDDAEDVDVRS